MLNDSALHKLIECWRNCDFSEPPFILPEDEPVIADRITLYRSFDEYIASKDFGQRGDKRLHVGHRPLPYIGALDKASIFILMLNPGLSPGDYFVEFRVPEFRQYYFRNLKQENSKVADELQVGLDHVSALQYEIDKILTKLGEQYGFSNSKKQRNTEMRYSNNSSDGGNRSQVPLGAFIFGVKPKKPRHSIFHGISPGMHRKYRAAIKGQLL